MDGLNVYPREVEEVLSRHPAVAQVAVIGVPDPEQGEEVCAVVVAATDAGRVDADELIAWSREHLGGHKVPTARGGARRPPDGSLPQGAQA